LSAKKTPSRSASTSMTTTATAAQSVGTATAPPEQLPRAGVQRIAEEVRAPTGALFLVVTDDRNLRLAHPNTTSLGQTVSTDPSMEPRGEASEPLPYSEAPARGVSYLVSNSNWYASSR
jgi:sensor histidine kinase regulating citrate/malate metabolism